MMKSSARRAVLCMLILLLCGSALFGCSPAGKQQNGLGGPVTVVMAASEDPTNIDPHKVTGDTGANVMRSICESLLSYDNDWQLIPWLAKSWEQISENEWLFHLEEGVKFSNGEPFNAQAAVYNLDRGASKEYPRQAMDYVKYYDHSEAVGEYTVKIVTTHQCVLMPNYMADAFMLAPKYMEDVGEDNSWNQICGTGPYVLESWVPDQQITLKAREDWWKGETEVDTFVIRTIPEKATRIAELIAGNVDIVLDLAFEDIPAVEAAGYSCASKLERRVQYIAFNTADWSPTPELKDQRVRLAINYAVDMEAIVGSIMGGYGTILASWYRADQPFYLKGLEGIPYDPDKARQLLADAGYADGFDVTIMSHTGSFAKANEVSQAVAGYMQAVGINATVEVVEYNTMRNVIINGQAQKLAKGMFVWSWAGKPAMIESWLTGIVKSDGMSSYNTVGGYDELVDEILSIERPEDRQAKYEELQRRLVEDPPYLYLFQSNAIYGVSPRLDWNPMEHMYIIASDMRMKNK